MANFWLFYFCFWFVFGHVLAISWPYMARGASGLNFFIDARDGTAGRRADVARIDEKIGGGASGQNMS